MFVRSIETTSTGARIYTTASRDRVITLSHPLNPVIYITNHPNVDALISRWSSCIVARRLVERTELFVYQEKALFNELVISDLHSCQNIVASIDNSPQCDVFVYEARQYPLSRFQIETGIKCNRWYTSFDPIQGCSHDVPTGVRVHMLCISLETQSHIVHVLDCTTNRYSTCSIDDINANISTCDVLLTYNDGGKYIIPTVFPRWKINIVDDLHHKVKKYNVTPPFGILHVDLHRWSQDSGVDIDAGHIPNPLSHEERLRLTQRLEAKWNIVQDLFVNAELSNLTPQLVFNSSMSTKIEGASLEKRMLSNIIRITPASFKKKYGDQTVGGLGGGLVLDTVPGRYDKAFSLLLDISSMYPSLVIKNNFCHSTMSADGNTFVSAEERKGMLPAFVEELLDKRARSTNPFAKSFYKLMANASIGRTGQAGCDDYLWHLNSAITKAGRELLQHIVTEIEKDSRMRVLYGDTDSVIVYSELFDTEEHALWWGQRLSSAHSNAPITLKFEAIFKNLVLTDKKKRYTALIHAIPRPPAKIESPPLTWELHIKGHTFLASDATPIIRDIGTELSRALVENPSELPAIQEKYDKLFADKNISIDKLAKKIKITKQPQQYASSSDNAAASVLLREGKADADPGTAIRVVIARSGIPSQRAINDRAVRPKDIYTGMAIVDWDYYKHEYNELLQPHSLKRPISDLQHHSICVLCKTKKECTHYKWLGMTCDDCKRNSTPDTLRAAVKNIEIEIQHLSQTCTLECNRDIEDCANYGCDVYGAVRLQHSRLPTLKAFCIKCHAILVTDDVVVGATDGSVSCFPTCADKR